MDIRNGGGAVCDAKKPTAAAPNGGAAPSATRPAPQPAAAVGSAGSTAGAAALFRHAERFAANGHSDASAIVTARPRCQRKTPKPILGSVWFARTLR